MVEKLSSIIHPLGDGRCTPCSPLCMHGGREACGVLHEAGRYPLGAIGPVKLMWEPSEGGGKVDRRVWVWVHPACVEQAQNALVTVGKGVSVQDLSGALARLEIRGHDAWNLAQKLILPSSSGEGDLLWGAGQNDLFHDGAAISVCAWDPRVSCPAPHHRGKFDTGAFAAQDVGAQGSNAGAHASFLADASHEDVSRVPLWSIGASAGAASLWDVTARVAASKRRATDKQIHETRRGRLLRTWAEEGRCCCPVLAVCVKGGGLPPGIDIIVPAGWGGIFWKA